MTEQSTAVLTDLHLEPDNEELLFETLDETLRRIRSLSPDQIVVLGDLVQETDVSTDMRLIEAFVERLSNVDIPYRCLVGNHDVAELTAETYTEIVGNAAYGVSGNHVYLDSTSQHRSDGGGEIDDEQLQFLETALASLSSATIFVHHPIHYRDISGNRWFGESPDAAFCKNTETVLDVLESASTDITAVINGHLHEWNHTVYRDIDHLSIDSFNNILEPNGETGGFALVEDGARLRVTRYDADGSEPTVLYCQ